MRRVLNTSPFALVYWLLVVSAVVAVYSRPEQVVVPSLVAVAGGLVLMTGLCLRKLGRTGPRPVEAIAPVDEPTPVTLAGTSEPPPDLRSWITISIGLHFVVGAACFFTDLNLALAPDSVAYVIHGTVIAESWADPSIDPSLSRGYFAKSLFQQLNAVGVWVVGEAYAGLVVGSLNGVVGTCAAWMLSRLAHRLYGAEAAKRTFLMAAFFPSIVLWTSINLRDAWSYLFMAGALLGAQQIRAKVSSKSVALFVGSLVGMAFVRPYLMFVLGLAVMLSYAALRLRQVPAMLVSVALAGLLLVNTSGQFGRITNFTNFDLEERLALVQELNVGMAKRGRAYGESFGKTAYQSQHDLTTFGGIARHLPVGVVMFLMSPFPWSIHSLRQASAVPETLVWYAILVHALIGIWRGVHRRFSAVAAPVFAALATTLGYALVEANEGTAFRHRAHVMLILFVFAAGEQARRAAKSRRTTT